MASFSSSSTSSTPKLSILLREKTGLKYFEGPPSLTPTDGAKSKTSPSADPILTIPSLTLRMGPFFSSDGARVMWTGALGTPIEVRMVSDGTVMCTVPCKDSDDMFFSPLGTFCVTWSPMKKGTATKEPPPNLCVWRLVKNGEATLEAGFHLKKQAKDALQWSCDEAICTRMNTNEVHILNGHNPGGHIITKVYHKNVTCFCLGKWHSTADSSSKTTHIMVFTPEDKGKPARVAAYPILLKNDGSVDVLEKCAERTVFSANEAKLLFSPSGKACLVHTHADVDTSGESYFGATGLFVVSMDGKLAEQVDRSKAGPVYDVQWSPVDDVFVVAAGTMPAHCTLYNDKAVREFEFGAAHRNTISWSPHGRFLCLAGFGNLAGDMDFYDVHRRKPFGSASSHCAVSYGWSPDSRYFMTATLAPRMNVDNGLKIFKYNGAGPVMTLDASELAYVCTWRPASTGIYEGRPPSPGSRRVQGAAGTDTSTTEKPAAYRPPGARESIVSQMMRNEQGKAKGLVGKVSTKTQSYRPPSASLSTSRSIPGMNPVSISNDKDQVMSKAQQKNARRREKKKEEQSANSSSTSKDNPTPILLSPEPITRLDPAVELEKKVKALNKKLKSITELKDKHAGGGTLNADQIEKLSQEETLLEQLRNLTHITTT